MEQIGISQLAKICRCSQKYLSRLVAEGVLPPPTSKQKQYDRPGKYEKSFSRAAIETAVGIPLPQLPHTLLTVREAARWAHCSQKELMEAVRNRKLFCVTLGDSYRFRMQDVFLFVTQETPQRLAHTSLADIGVSHETHKLFQAVSVAYVWHVVQYTCADLKQLGIEKKHIRKVDKALQKQYGLGLAKKR